MIILIYTWMNYNFIIDLFKNSLNNWIIWIWQWFNWYQLLFSLKIVNNVQCGYNKWCPVRLQHLSSSKNLRIPYIIYIGYILFVLPPASPQTISFLDGLPTSYQHHRLPRAVTALKNYQIINKNINVIKLIDYLMIVQCGYSSWQPFSIL